MATVASNRRIPPNFFSSEQDCSKPNNKMVGEIGTNI